MFGSNKVITRQARRFISTTPFPTQFKSAPATAQTFSLPSHQLQPSLKKSFQLQKTTTANLLSSTTHSTRSFTTTRAHGFKLTPKQHRSFSTTTLLHSQHLAFSTAPKQITTKIALLPRNTPIHTQQRRNMSIGSFFTDKVEGKKMEMQQHKERESYRQLRDFLISCPRFRFKELLAYFESLQAQIGKTDRLIGGQDIKLQEDMLKRKIAAFKAMTPLEQLHDSPGAFNMAAKSRIQVATGVDKKDLEADFKQFDEMKMMHTWLHRRLKNAKSIPDTSIEMHKMMQEDPPPQTWTQQRLIQKMQNAQKRAGGRR